MQDTDGWNIDADLAIPHLQNLGWQIESVVWQQEGVVWNDYAAVYIGTPWDYPDDPQNFMQVLQTIDNSDATLVNDVRIVRWNIEKTYLRDLQAGGADIVPTIFDKKLQSANLEHYFDAHRSDRIIIKPVVSTNATDTFLLERNLSDEVRSQLLQAFSERQFMVQPFIPAIQSEGEYSLFYFADEFSHAILKTPIRADFRVQEEYGADILQVQPEAALIAAADKALQLVNPAPVYARCDFVRADDGRFLVMELELIEPSMYLRTKDDSSAKFAAAFDRYVKQRSLGQEFVAHPV